MAAPNSKVFQELLLVHGPSVGDTMPALGELTVLSNMIHYHILIPTNGKGNGAMGVRGSILLFKG